MIVMPAFLIDTPAMSFSEPPSAATDLISELLTGMRLRGVQYRRIQTGPEFGIGFEDRPGCAYFHYVAVGTAFLRMSGGELVELSPGSATFLPHGTEHQLLSEPGISFNRIDTFDASHLGEAVRGVDTCPSTHAIPSAVLFYGCMELDLGSMQRLGEMMPEVMVGHTGGKQYPDLEPILDAMKREICSGRIGYAGILARLAEVAASMIVRGWIECGTETASGLIAALRDPRLARAILALHRNPGKNWTVSELAEESFVSRSVFAQRFQSTIGVSPLRYATELKMRLASQWLIEEKLSIEDVGLRLGYASQAAFSRAYKRFHGRPPGISRQIAA